MKCKKCKNEMSETEQGNEDGMITIVRECEECGTKSKSWYDIDECTSSNTSWVDKNGKSLD